MTLKLRIRRPETEAKTTPDTHHVSLTVDKRGFGRLVVDDEEQTHARGVVIRAAAGDLTRVEIEHTVVDVSSEIEASVQRVVVIAVNGDHIKGEGTTLAEALRHAADQLETP